ncbi:hypothetical protein LXL04_002858 [Taraxacum kok-saghyz]
MIFEYFTEEEAVFFAVNWVKMGLCLGLVTAHFAALVTTEKEAVFFFSFWGYFWDIKKDKMQQGLFWFDWILLWDHCTNRWLFLFSWYGVIWQRVSFTGVCCYCWLRWGHPRRRKRFTSLSKSRFSMGFSNWICISLLSWTNGNGMFSLLLCNWKAVRDCFCNKFVLNFYKNGPFLFEALGSEVNKVPSKSTKVLDELELASELDKLSAKLDDVDEMISSAMAANPQVKSLLSNTADVWMPLITATSDERQMFAASVEDTDKVEEKASNENKLVDMA